MASSSSSSNRIRSRSSSRSISSSRRNSMLLLCFAFLAQIAAGRLLNSSPSWLGSSSSSSSSNQGGFVLALARRSLADSVFPPLAALAPSPGPSLQPGFVSPPAAPAETSIVSPSGTSFQGPIASVAERRPKHRINKGVLASIILVPTIVCGSILLSSYISLESIRMRLKQAFSHGDDYSAPPTPPIAPQHGGKSPVPFISVPQEKPKPAHPMDYSLLEKVTDGFSDEFLIGEGGFARVYRARVHEESILAVKKLSKENDQAEQEFQAEIELMGKIHHPNLLALVGFSSRGDDHLLIYELMRKGSLQDQLQGPAQGAALTWHRRLKIALDAARGLEYLHDQCNPPVIHRDFKSSNILLDADFGAKLSDFGLALSVESGSNKAGSLQLQGTFGYVAPEYILTGILTEKSDVYAFGVVLLELITGRKPIDMSMPTGCQSLVTWATPQLTDRTRLPQIVDAAIKDTVNLKQLFQVAAIAVLCVQSEPSYRPLIGDVVNSLVPLVPVDLGGAMRVGSETGPYGASL